MRRHGEANAILELMTRAHGRHLGLVRGGAGSRLRPVLQPGNGVSATWRARLDEHLGHFAVEGMRLRAGAFMTAAHAVYGVTHLAALCRLLPERDPHEAVHDALEAVLDHLDDRPLAAALVARFELRCSPSSASASISTSAPRPARPPTSSMCRRNPDARSRARPASRGRTGCCGCRRSCARRAVRPRAMIAAGFALTGFFLARHVLEPRGAALPDARERFIAAVLREQPVVTAARAETKKAGQWPGLRRQ